MAGDASGQVGAGLGRMPAVPVSGRVEALVARAAGRAFRHSRRLVAAEAFRARAVAGVAVLAAGAGRSGVGEPPVGGMDRQRAIRAAVAAGAGLFFVAAQAPLPAAERRRTVSPVEPRAVVVSPVASPRPQAAERGAGLEAPAGAGGAALRWTGTALTAEPLPLAMLQPLHAVSFAMTMVGAAQLIARMVPPERGATAQALHSALGPGLATAVLNPLSGVLYERFGGGSFLAMAAVAAASWPGIAALGRMTAGQPAMSDPETRL